ncbi:VanZ family protein [Streptococcus sp. S784/96/1]|uniref:VanZ family protein n=1 Tax=Streptococcus sp. S784/96/1 TaxID=2653499 RepID=UPI0013868C02|nr:VanZ family protein [Streptococcus sp. S784/96/1]
MPSFFDKQAELTLKGRQLTWSLVILYSLTLVLLCWTPQYGTIEGVETPNVFSVGRMVFLLVPFNSLIGFGELDTALEIFWVITQNVMNIFLIFPLMLGLLGLFPNLRNLKKILWLSFAISLTIEVGQLILDLLIDANRVFEIDDLWTNTLGGVIAFWTFNKLQTLLRVGDKL